MLYSRGWQPVSGLVVVCGSRVSLYPLLHNSTSSAIPEILIRWNFPLDFLSYRNRYFHNAVSGGPGPFLPEDPNLTPLSVQLPMPLPHQVIDLAVSLSTDRGPGSVVLLGCLKSSLLWGSMIVRQFCACCGEGTGEASHQMGVTGSWRTSN